MICTVPSGCTRVVVPSLPGSGCSARMTIGCGDPLETLRSGAAVAVEPTTALVNTG